MHPIQDVFAHIGPYVGKHYLGGPKLQVWWSSHGRHMKADNPKYISRNLSTGNSLRSPVPEEEAKHLNDRYSVTKTITYLYFFLFKLCTMESDAAELGALRTLLISRLPTVSKWGMHFSELLQAFLSKTSDECEAQELKDKLTRAFPHIEDMLPSPFVYTRAVAMPAPAATVMDTKARLIDKINDLYDIGNIFATNILYDTIELCRIHSPQDEKTKALFDIAEVFINGDSTIPELVKEVLSIAIQPGEVIAWSKEYKQLYIDVETIRHIYSLQNQQIESLNLEEITTKVEESRLWLYYLQYFTTIFNNKTLLKKEKDRNIQLLPYAEQLMQDVTQYQGLPEFPLFTIKLLNTIVYTYTQIRVNKDFAQARSNLLSVKEQCERLLSTLLGTDVPITSNLLDVATLISKLGEVKATELIELYTNILYTLGRLYFYGRPLEFKERSIQWLMDSYLICKKFNLLISFPKKLFQEVLSARNGFLYFLLEGDYEQVQEILLATKDRILCPLLYDGCELKIESKIHSSELAIRYYEDLLRSTSIYRDQNQGEVDLSQDIDHKLICYKQLVMAFREQRKIIDDDVSMQQSKKDELRKMLCGNLRNLREQFTNLLDQTTSSLREKHTEYLNLASELNEELGNLKEAVSLLERARDIALKKTPFRVDHTLGDIYFNLARIEFMQFRDTSILPEAKVKALNSAYSHIKDCELIRGIISESTEKKLEAISLRAEIEKAFRESKLSPTVLPSELPTPSASGQVESQSPGKGKQRAIPKI